VSTLTLQLKAAERGAVTEEMKRVAEDEGCSAETLRERVRDGTVVIARSSVNEEIPPIGIGEGLRIKVNANVGTSMDVCDPSLELRKAKVAVRFGAETVMDLSTAGDLNDIRWSLLKAVTVPLGTVPIYQAAIDAINSRGSIVDMKDDDVFNVIKRHAKDGVAFMTVHCGVTKPIIEHLKRHPRVTGIVSRGGTFLAAWILHNDRENPLYKDFDYLLEIAREFDFCISLGDGLRPGCLTDSSDWAQVQELLTIGELVERARKAGVQCIVEGPGHMPLNQIASHVALEKAVCKGAPYYLLGPLVTDIGAPYDHIVGAIGGALASMAGADYLCVVTPAEHLSLPSVDDVKEGVIAAKLAAHACDIVRLGKNAGKLDMDMARARAKLDWKTQLRLSINPEKARVIHGNVGTSTTACSMCGPFCTYKIIAKYFGDREVVAEKCM